MWETYPIPETTLINYTLRNMGERRTFAREISQEGVFERIRYNKHGKRGGKKKVVPSSFTLVTSLIKQAGGEAGGVALKSGEERHRYMMHFTKFPGYRTKKNVQRERAR